MIKLPQFVLFTIVGGIAALVNIVARILFNLITPFELAVALAFAVGLITAFVLNREFVFAVRGGNIAAQYWRFFVVNTVALVQVFAVSALLARAILPWAGWTWNTETVAHVMGVLSPILSSFVLHRNFTFVTYQQPLPARRQFPVRPAGGFASNPASIDEADRT